MGPDPTRAYFWPAVNKRPTQEADPPLTRVLSDPTQRDFFWSEGKKIENFDIFRGNFPNSNPNLKLTRPGSKIFDPDPSLGFLDECTESFRYSSVICDSTYKCLLWMICQNKNSKFLWISKWYKIPNKKKFKSCLFSLGKCQKTTENWCFLHFFRLKLKRFKLFLVRDQQIDAFSFLNEWQAFLYS